MKTKICMQSKIYGMKENDWQCSTATQSSVRKKSLIALKIYRNRETTKGELRHSEGLLYLKKFKNFWNYVSRKHSRDTFNLEEVAVPNILQKKNIK